MNVFRGAAQPGKQEVELFFGELKEGALLDRCRTDTHKIVLSLVDGQPVAVRLEPLGTYRMLPAGAEVTTLERQFLDGSVELVRVFEERDL